jgi:ABC-type multidrug transport system fused ATPase/permease subunit
VTVFSDLLKIIPRNRYRSLAIIFLLMTIAMLLEMLSIGIFVPAISLFTTPDSHNALNAVVGWVALSGMSTLQIVMLGLGSLVSVYFLKSLYLAFFTWKQNAFAFALLRYLTEQLYQGYLNAPWLFHVENNSAVFLRNINTEVNLVINNVLIPVLRLISECLVLAGITLLLSFYEPVGTVVVIAFMLISSVLIQKLTRNSLMHWGNIRQVTEAKRIQQLQEGLSSAKEIKLLGRESNFVDKFRGYNKQSARAGQFRMFYQQLPRLLLETLAISGLSVLIITLLLQGRNFDAVLPAVALYAAAVFRLMPSVNRILEALQNLNYGTISLTVLQEQLARVKSNDVDTSSGQVNFERHIEFQNVSITYPGGNKPVLDNINIRINKGECIGLIGASGAGKTTLVDMLLGLISPTGGDILADGVSIKDNLAGWRKNLGYVPQEINLLDDSLKKNIAFGLDEASIDNDRVEKAVKAARLEELVNALPDGLQSTIGERGVKLSGGQRQRIGIARAMYRDPKILVLDEATSALDTETESHILDAINNLDAGKTIIMIAHRLTTVANCDCIYQVQNGSVSLAPDHTAALSRA